VAICSQCVDQSSSKVRGFGGEMDKFGDIVGTKLPLFLPNWKLRIRDFDGPRQGSRNLLKSKLLSAIS
jgi:hypothetical protein